MTRLSDEGSQDNRSNITNEIVSKVASYLGTSPLELGLPLADVVDPDALEIVAESPNTKVLLDYHGVELIVSDSKVEIVAEAEY